MRPLVTSPTPSSISSIPACPQCAVDPGVLVGADAAARAASVPVPSVVHPPWMCAGESCPAHNPSDHHMRDWPAMVRVDRWALTERLCEHGCGHPDPDSLAWLSRMVAAGRFPDGADDSTHGCCGCCLPPASPTPATESGPVVGSGSGSVVDQVDEDWFDRDMRRIDEGRRLAEWILAERPSTTAAQVRSMDDALWRWPAWCVRAEVPVVPGVRRVVAGIVERHHAALADASRTRGEGE